MSTFTSLATLTLNPEGSTRQYTATNTVTDDLLHAYVQEFQLTGAENEVVWDTADDPGYSDFVLLRIEVLEWGDFDFIVPVKITSGADSMYLSLARALPVLEIYGVDVWTDDSAGGSADTIDEVTVIGAGDGVVGLSIASPMYIRVTAYTVAS